MIGTCTTYPVSTPATLNFGASSSTTSTLITLDAVFEKLSVAVTDNLSYLCYANVLTNGPNFVYADRLSYKPELYFVSTVYLDVLYPSLTVSDRLAKVKSVTFNFNEYILPYTSTGKTVSHKV